MLFYFTKPSHLLIIFCSTWILTDLIHNFSFRSVAFAMVGWLFYQVPRIIKLETTWKLTFGYLGVAMTVGYVTGNVAIYMHSDLEPGMLNSICALAGASCDYWLPKGIETLKKIFDKNTKTS
jgi:hypothetical protein